MSSLCERVVPFFLPHHHTLDCEHNTCKSFEFSNSSEQRQYWQSTLTPLHAQNAHTEQHFVCSYWCGLGYSVGLHSCAINERAHIDLALFL
jgi:hypothetical protein